MPCFLFLVIPIRYLIWNLYGKENLIINSKTISYNYDYGFIRTNLKTIPFYHLGAGIELYKENKGIQEGKLILYNFRAQDNLPEIIHETTVLVNLEDVKEIDIEISKLFLKEFNHFVRLFYTNAINGDDGKIFR